MNANVTALRLASIALLLATSAAAQARTHVAPHVFETKSLRCAQGTHFPKATLEPRRAAGAPADTCDATAVPADEMRLRESPTRAGGSEKKEFKGHVTVLK